MMPCAPDFGDLAGRRVLITGASSGIGAAIAQAFGAARATVGVHFHTSAAAAETLVGEIEASGGRAAAFYADLSSADDRRSLVERVTTTFDGLDVLINNAGCLGTRVPFHEGSEELFDAVFNVNVRAGMDLIRRLIPFLSKSGTGCIINTSSLASRTGGSAGSIVYAASKGAINTMSIGLARELGPLGIRVNVVSPGTILTPLHERLTAPEILEARRREIPMGRLGKPEDCVGAYLFLASPRLSGYISGAVIEVSGGRI